MSLVDIERALVRTCFAREPREDDLARLGADRERWLLYRRMARSRLAKMLATALPRTAAALGEDAFGAWTDRWLDEAPPRTRYIREIVPEMVGWASPRLREDPSLPAWLADLAIFELAIWEVAWTEAAEPEVVDLDFERVPALDPTLRLLDLGHPVHRKGAEGAGGFPEQRETVAVWRNREDFSARWRVAGALEVALIRSFDRGCTITAACHEVSRELDVPLDETFVARLTDVLAALVERGIVRGSRP